MFTLKETLQGGWTSRIWADASQTCADSSLKMKHNETNRHPGIFPGLLVTRGRGSDIWPYLYSLVVGPGREFWKLPQSRVAQTNITTDAQWEQSIVRWSMEESALKTAGFQKPLLTWESIVVWLGICSNFVWFGRSSLLLCLSLWGQ